MEASKLRIGTRCKACGREMESGEDSSLWIKTRTTKDPIAYVCPDCLAVYAYGTDAQKRLPAEKGKDTKAHLRQAIEVEFFFHEDDYSRDETLAFLAANYHLVFSHDCTVDVEAHEQITANVHGFKERWRGIASVVDLTRPGCGHHINLSVSSWGDKDVWAIVEHKEELFGRLLYRMMSNRKNTEDFWGRYFTDYCEASFTMEHGDWLNLYNLFDERDKRRIEFRLPKFQNENQFFYLVNFCRDVTLLLDKFMDDGGNMDAAKRTESKILKLYDKYINGKANCQRPERNRA